MSSQHETPEFKAIRNKRRAIKNPDRQRNYVAANREKVRETKKAYAEKHKEKYKAYKKQYYIENKERHDENRRKWKLKNPDWSKNWRAKNPGYDRKMYIKHRDARIAREHARRLKTERYDLDLAQRLGDKQNWKCPDCGVCIKKKNHMDHIMPIKLGGKHVEENLRLTCPTCNLRKNAKHPDKWANELGKLFL